MTMMRWMTAGALAVMALPGCNDEVQACTPGRQVECACEDGTASVQACTKGGVFEECRCGQTADARVPDAARTNDSGVDRGTPIIPGGSSSPVDPGNVSSGDRDAAALVDARVLGGDPGPVDASAPASGVGFIAMFARDGSLWSVDTAGIARFELASGAEVARWNAPRPLTSAAFDGTYLVALDGAKLSTLEPTELTMGASGDLVESCRAAVFVNDGRLICGPANDWDRVFYTYDAASGKLLASSQKYTYNGIPMRRVPSLNAFVTVSVDSSPSDFHLYTVGADNAAKFENESPYHGDFPIDDSYAFDGSPPTHLITAYGLRLKFAVGCGTSNTCFVKDGALGTLSGAQRFVALDGDGKTLVAIVDTSGSSYYVPGQSTAANYLLQTIDLPSRTVTGQRVINLPAGAPLAFQALLADKKVALAARKAGDDPYASPYPSSGAPAYDLLTFDLP